jgi:hypothetical protein
MATTTVIRGYNPPNGWTSGEIVTPEKLNSAQTPSVAVTIEDGEITAQKLATGAVTGAAGGGKLAASAITAQTAIDALANDDELLIHDDSNTALRKVAWSQIVAAAQPAGSVVGSEYAELVGVQTYSGSLVTTDITTPTTSSGHQLLSKAYACSNSSNHVIISVSSLLADSGGNYAILMLFAGSTLIATRHTGGSDAGHTNFVIKHSPNSTSSVTYSVRGGANAGDLLVNRIQSTTGYNTGKNITSMLIQEIKG